MLAALLLVSACGSSESSAPGEAAPDRAIRGPQGSVGQFVVECDLSHLAPDDPIVHAGHAGASHLHQFFGATGVGADSTYDELVAGGTSCSQRLDTASYWAPALFGPDRATIEPLRSVAYYRAGIGVDPTQVVPYPPGLMLVGGDQSAIEPQPTSIVAWSCGTGSERAARPPDCAGAPSLRMLVTYPDCWDGERLVADDFVSHATYSTGGTCPDTHPVHIPQLQFAIDYPVVDPAGLALASGDILTGHADFWNAWDQDKLAHEVSVCVNNDLVCGI